MPAAKQPDPIPGGKRPARIGPLAILPLFFPLTAARVVLAGGSDAAAWKAELLASAGARLDVYAPSGALSDEFRALLRSSPAQGSIVHHDRVWGLDVFDGATLAVADCESEAEAQTFRCAARAAGLPVNVIDKPRYCSFQFGSIVNRSPFVIGISTSGAGPIMGQRIRQMIEAMLPPQLSGWGALAAKLRGHVAANLAMGLERRRFWEAFADRAMRTDPPVPGDMEEFAASFAGADKAVGLVWYVGCGTGEPDMLTLKALRALQGADVVVSDSDVAPATLELARREAHHIRIGRECAKNASSSHAIAGLIAALREDGKSVARLTAGSGVRSPALAGEMRVLCDLGVALEFIPGVEACTRLPRIAQKKGPSRQGIRRGSSAGMFATETAGRQP